MPCLSRLRAPVLPRGGSFRVHGLCAHADAAVFADGSLLSCGYDHIELSTLQGRVDVDVTVEEWDRTPPPSGAAEWEETAAALVYLRGYVAIGGDARARSAGLLRLAGGVGRYRAEVRARMRHEVARCCDRLLHRDAAGAEFRRAAEGLRGREAFLILLWPAGEVASGPA
ncbi:hypothetical protein FZ103_19710 [Streptomonospora sp. PA3]|uniref:hypothetical protein n=1 Tax=Streptomonospora sp. PA3 TaxID=2607326 RepID=UPI0012DDB727|nr:hypothetical protein [Streptomonospora sp. PA3]MUL43367.1 hypothetical protein [Streptomonospora sp. PA3]